MKNNIYTLKALLIQIFCFMLAVPQTTQAATYFSRQSGNWSSPATWSMLYHGDPNPGTTLPGASDVIMIGKGHAITIDANATAYSITVGDSGLASLLFGSASNHSLTVTTFLNVATGCSVAYNQNAGRSHSLTVGGGMSNNGSINLYIDANDFVNLTFNGSATTANVNGNGSWTLNQVILNKADKNKTLNVFSNPFEVAIKSIDLQRGTYRHINSGTFSVNSTASSAQIIAPNVKFHVAGGSVDLSPSNTSMTLQGALIVTSGTLRVCSTNGSDGIRYEQVGATVPSISVSASATMIVNGGIRPSATQPTSALNYLQTSGTVRLNAGRTSTGETTLSMGSNTDSQFMLTGGTLVFEKATNGGPAASDIDLSGNSVFVDITGGTMQFGWSSTPTNSTFRFSPYVNVLFPHVWLTGPGGANITLRPSMNNTEDIQMMSLRIDANKTFDIRSSSGATGDSRTLTLSSTYDNNHTLFNNGTMNMRSSTLAIEGWQALGMNAASNTSLHSLRINTPAGVNMYRSFQVAGRLDLMDGKLVTTAASPVICLTGSSWSPGSMASFVDGPFHARLSLSSQSTVIFPVGDQAAFRPMSLTVAHNNTTPVEYKAEVVNASAQNFGFSLPGTLTHVSDVRYFRLERESISNLSSAVLNLVYGSDDVVTEPLGLRVARDNGSGSWIDLGGDASTSPAGAINTDPFYAFNSYFALANGTGFNNPLPVELVLFEGKARSASVGLNWTTSSEVNSDYFDVERSTDGVNFTSIGRVQAAGFSTTVRKYVLDDRQPIRGINYYRLRQVDRDGTSDYSNIISVRFVPTRLEVFPNPATGTQLTIRLPEGMGNVQAELTDLEGRIVASPSTLQDGFTTPVVDISNLSTGAYMLRITDAAGSAWTERIVVSH